MIDQTAEQAARGARLLDERKPGWHRKVDLLSLDIARASDCVVAQVYGGYGRGLVALRLDDREVGTHGFVTSWGHPTDRDALNDAWRTEIQLRLNGSDRLPLGMRLRLAVRRLLQMPH